MNTKINLIICMILSFQTITPMHIEQIETNEEVSKYNNPLFPSLKELAAKEIVTSCGNLIFEDKPDTYKKYEFKNLPKNIKIQLLEALINKDGFTQKTKNSSLFKRWIKEENWLDESYHFTNIPITHKSHIRSQSTLVINPYHKIISKNFYPENSTLETNCYLYYKGSSTYEVCNFRDSRNLLDYIRTEKNCIKINNLNTDTEIILIINQGS